MSKDMIRYDLMVQDALKGVLRKLLTDAVRDGMPGDHHFYITFRTQASGVRLSQRMREKYPEEMTVVLQHQFWDLGVTEHAFEVGLSFGGVPERLLVPFDSISGFFDPSVKFGLKFELPDDAAASEEEMPATPKRPLLTSVPSEAQLADEANAKNATAKKALKAKTTKGTHASEPESAAKTKLSVENSNTSKDDAGKNNAGNDKTIKDSGTKEKISKDRLKVIDAPVDAPQQEGGAKILSLDAFRKKT